VAWNASDADGDPLTFGLLYSRDDGATWQVIASGLRASSTTWNTLLSGGTAPGSFSRVKVVASDGFNTAEAISNRFSVAGKPPIVSIVAPADDTHLVEGRAVHFEGFANDLEDGLLSGSSLAWSSSRDGVLGTGAAFSR